MVVGDKNSKIRSLRTYRSSHTVRHSREKCRVLQAPLLAFRVNKSAGLRCAILLDGRKQALSTGPNADWKTFRDTYLLDESKECCRILPKYVSFLDRSTACSVIRVMFHPRRRLVGSYTSLGGMYVVFSRN